MTGAQLYGMFEILLVLTGPGLFACLVIAAFRYGAPALADWRDQ